MEFGSLGFSSQPQPTSPSPANLSSNATIQSNPEQVVTSPEQGAAPENDRRRDTLGRQAEDIQRNNRETDNDEFRVTSRRTTLSFDTEQNRVFLEVIDSNTDEVVERIPSENLVAFISRALEDATRDAAEASSEGLRIDQSV